MSKFIEVYSTDYLTDMLVNIDEIVLVVRNDATDPDDVAIKLRTAKGDFRTEHVRTSYEAIAGMLAAAGKVVTG